MGMEEGEKVCICYEGSYVVIKVRMKRSLWNDIRRRAKESGYEEMDKYIFEMLADIATFGLPSEWIEGA